VVAVSFSAKPHDLRERERAIAALVRAGHRFALARAIVAMEPGSDADVDKLSESY